MRPLPELPAERLRTLRGLLFDLDDTFLDHGRLTLDAYSALFDLDGTGLDLFAVTGRPAAWGSLIARQWPIAGAVTENGAIAYHRDGADIVVLDRVAPPERRERRARLAALAGELQGEFPELELTDDVTGRLSDVTFDIGEGRRVDPLLVDRARAFAVERGARTHVSSVHLHLTFDADDKASGVLRTLHEVRNLDVTAARYLYAFVGDSQNDEACFNAFDVTVAVRNFSGRPTRLPRYVTDGERAAGFVELAQRLVAARGKK
ncbi:MAG TPA: hypothetical protein VF989_17125 [Polyangiaceae bacterium]